MLTKKIFIVLIILGNLMVSCASQNKRFVTSALPSLPDTLVTTSERKFDLSFLDQEVKKSYVDSVGNLVIVDPVLDQRIRSFLTLCSTELLALSVVDTITVLDLSNKESVKVESQKIVNIV